MEDEGGRALRCRGPHVPARGERNDLPEQPVEVELCNCTMGANSCRDIHWQIKTSIPVEKLQRPGDGTLRIPVMIDIPSEFQYKHGPITSLELHASFPGINYKSYFSVPVYLMEYKTNGIRLVADIMFSK